MNVIKRVAPGAYSKRVAAVLLVATTLVTVSCGRSARTSSATATTSAGSTACSKQPLAATDVGVTSKTITVEVSVDVGSALAPGLFQSNVDGAKAYASYVNQHGGIGCRNLVVRTWDSKLSAEESKNGQIDSCQNAFAMVGGDSIFNPDVQALRTCKDSARATTGLPDIPALAVDVHEYCNPTTYAIGSTGVICPVRPGVQGYQALVGDLAFYEKQAGSKLQGLFLVPGDLPTSVHASTYQVEAQRQAGVELEPVKAAAADLQTAFTPKVQALKAMDGNFVFNGGNDRAMINLRKEAKAQGLTSVKVWACYACYTRSFLANGGRDVDGTYIRLGSLPFEEADTNPAVKAFVDAMGGPDKADSFGAGAWQAGMLFKQAVDRIVTLSGPNAITRARLLEELANTKDFSADGWLGDPTPVRANRSCFLMLQVQGGKFVRVYPTKRGTFDCKAQNLVTVQIDPVAEAAKIK